MGVLEERARTRRCCWRCWLRRRPRYVSLSLFVPFTPPSSSFPLILFHRFRSLSSLLFGLSVRRVPLPTDSLYFSSFLPSSQAALLGLDPSAPSSSSSSPSTYTPRGRGRGRGAPRGASTYAPRGGRGGAAAYGAAPGRGSMKLDLRTKSLAVVGEGLVMDEDARKAVENWYEVSRKERRDGGRLWAGMKRRVELTSFLSLAFLSLFTGWWPSR